MPAGTPQPADDQVSVHVNISPRQFAHAHFAQVVTDAVADAALPPARLTIEITETSSLHASVSTLTSAEKLVANGVGISLDDFGTGQSSITALRRLPAASIKIDKAFVRDLLDDPRDAGLVAGLIRLGAGMSLTVVAEGVETDQQADWLRQQGCRLAQGFRYGRPAPVPAPGLTAASGGHEPGAEMQHGGG